MREIPLTNGGAALVDDEDYERLAQYEWTMFKRGYVIRAGDRKRTCGGKLLLRGVCENEPWHRSA